MQQQPATAPVAIPAKGTIVTITSNVDNSRQISEQIAREESTKTSLQKTLDAAKARLEMMKTEKELVQDPLYPRDPTRHVWRQKYSSDQIEGAARDHSRIASDVRAVTGRIIALQKELATRRLTGQLQDGKPVEIVVTGPAELVAAQGLKVGQRYAIEGSTRQEGPKMIIKFVMATPLN